MVRGILVALFALASLLVLPGASFAGCTKSVTYREVPGGEPQPAQLIECDESTKPALLEPSGQLTLCDPKVLAQTGVSFEACAKALDAARAGLRKAKLRAAVQKGESDATLTERYGASKSEIGALRTSVDLSGPIPAAAQPSEEAVQ